MPAPISVILPTLDAAAALPATAEALLEGVTGGLIGELVISDGGSQDATQAAAKALGALWVEGPAGRGGQVARGVAAASGDWLLILHADTRPAAGWAAAARRHIADHPGRAGWFRLRFRARGFAPWLVETGAYWRARALGLPWGDQGLLVAREVLEAAGGYPELPLMEDVALARRLKGLFRPLGADATTSARRYLRDGWARRVTRNLGLLARYAAGADPADLAARYARRG